jgi:hypothetical protein
MDKVDSLKIANDMALKWFEIHVSQRLTMVRFYLTVAALCIGAYLTAFHARNFIASIIIAALLACFTFLFKQFDRRTAQLIKHSEAVLKFSGATLAQELGTEKIDIVTLAEDKDGVLSFRQTLNVVYWLIAFTAFAGLIGALVSVV